MERLELGGTVCQRHGTLQWYIDFEVIYSVFSQEEDWSLFSIPKSLPKKTGKRMMILHFLRHPSLSEDQG